jgi:hypothetical protein
MECWLNTGTLLKYFYCDRVIDGQVSNPGPGSGSDRWGCYSFCSAVLSAVVAARHDPSFTMRAINLATKYPLCSQAHCGSASWTGKLVQLANTAVSRHASCRLIMSCLSVVSGTQRFENWMYSDDGSSKHLWNVGKLPPVYMELRPRRRQQSSYLLPLEPEIVPISLIIPFSLLGHLPFLFSINFFSSSSLLFIFLPFRFFQLQFMHICHECWNLEGCKYWCLLHYIDKGLSQH